MLHLLDPVCIGEFGRILPELGTTLFLNVGLKQVGRLLEEAKRTTGVVRCLAIQVLINVLFKVDVLGRLFFIVGVDVVDFVDLIPLRIRTNFELGMLTLIVIV